jgi:dipeptidyl aminopeptidase/acylaminoacyl peptidase
MVSEIELKPGTHFSSGEVVSPDGSKAALVATEKGQRLSLYDLVAKTGRVVDEVSAQRLEAGTLLLRTVTWKADQTLVYIRQGTQPDGAHRGQRGLSFRIAAREGPQEVAWVPVGQGEYLTNIFARSGINDVYAHVSEKLWRVSLSGVAPVLVKKDLPSPVGILTPAFSPALTHLAYQPLGPGKAPGLYIMSLADGKETLVVPRSEAIAFGTEWSPDGRHVAYYYGRRLAGEDYDILPAEDSPRLVTETIGIASASGQRVAMFSVQGLRLSGFSWAEDSKSIVFAGVSPKKVAAQEHFPTLDWKAVYTGDLAGKVQKIGDLPPLAGYSGVTFSAPGGAAHCLVCWNGGSGLYYLTSSQPAKLVDPVDSKQQFHWTSLPGSDLGRALVLTIDLPDHKRSVIEVFESRGTVLASGSDSLMLGIAPGPRFSYITDDPQKQSLVLRVMEVR